MEWRGVVDAVERPAVESGDAWRGRAVVAADMARIFAGARSGSDMRAAAPVAAAGREPPRRRSRIALALGAGGAAGLLAGLAVILGSNRPVVSNTTAIPRVAAAVATPAASPVRAEAITPERAPEPSVAFAERRRVAAALPEREIEPVQDDAPACLDDGGACDRADVLAADRALRVAYQDAIDAGVDRDRLAAIRDRWARMRAVAQDRPATLVASYDRMAGQLIDAAERESD